MQHQQPHFLSFQPVLRPRLGCFMLALLQLCVILPPPSVAAPSDRFKSFEIRIIRPKYFTKSSKFEIGVQFGAIVNQPFIYTFQGNGNITYHINEAIAVEVLSSYGISLDRREKNILEDNFAIQTVIHRTHHILGGALLWTPFYGKFRTSSSRLVYFDFFLLGGISATGIEYKREDCANSDDLSNNTVKSRVVNYPTGSAGGGQKIFLSKKVALRWDISYMIFRADDADNLCGAASRKAPLENVLIKVGISRFF